MSNLTARQLPMFKLSEYCSKQFTRKKYKIINYRKSRNLTRFKIEHLRVTPSSRPSLDTEGRTHAGLSDTSDGLLVQEG